MGSKPPVNMVKRCGGCQENRKDEEGGGREGVAVIYET
jgi:hypothetical protein